MASPGLLLLLLVSSSLLLSNVSTSPDEIKVFEMTPEETNKHLERVKKGLNFFRENADKIRLALVPFLSLPVCGPIAGPVLNLIMLLVSATNKNDKVLTTLLSEFKDLNIKLDNYHIEQKWDTWASGAYHKPEKKITVAWGNYITLLHSLKLAKDEAERERHREEFFGTYSNKYESATKDLQVLMEAKGTTFINNLGDMLAEHVRCHEKDIKEYMVFINNLIMKGSFLNDLYYKYKNIKSEATDAKAAEIAYGAGSVMFQVHKSCIFNNMKYVKLDVTDLINDPKDHKDRQKLAQKVTLFLSQTYDRYDWMVVAYLTKNSNHKLLKTENRHFLSGFTEVTRGEVTVAVARQVKGHYTKVEGLKSELDRCFTKAVLCSKVEKKLKDCVQASGSYTALHAYIDKGHASYTIVHSTPDAPYIYTRDCMKTLAERKGQFMIMIKSDEEMKRNPCDNLKCNGGKNQGTDRGKCVHAEDTFVAMCECKHPYYGKLCELSLKDYMKELQESEDELESRAKQGTRDRKKYLSKGPIAVDSRERTKQLNI